jgi:hypothetical protein
LVNTLAVLANPDCCRNPESIEQEMRQKQSSACRSQAKRSILRLELQHQGITAKNKSGIDIGQFKQRIKFNGRSGHSVSLTIFSRYNDVNCQSPSSPKSNPSTNRGLLNAAIRLLAEGNRCSIGG